MTIRRRALMLSGFACAALPALAGQDITVEVWRDPSCGCCAGWVTHLRAGGIVVRDNVIPDLAPIRRTLGTPADLLSCHAGRVAGYALEGHVPLAAVQKLLADRPRNVLGLAVPDMPIGSPGMEVPGQPDDIYDVIAFGTDGVRSLFMRFRGTKIL